MEISSYALGFFCLMFKEDKQSLKVGKKERKKNNNPCEKEKEKERKRNEK
jgi:hypothetical protein